MITFLYTEVTEANAIYSTIQNSSYLNLNLRSVCKHRLDEDKAQKCNQKALSQDQNC